MSRRSQDLIMQLGETWGGIAAQQGQRSFEQQAVDYFTTNDVNPENIQKFSEMTRAPIQDVFRLAAGIGQMRERQEVDDIGMSLINADKAGLFKKPEDVVKFLGERPGRVTSKQKAAQGYMQFKQQNADLFKKEGIKLGTGESYLMPDGAGGYETVASGGEATEMLTLYGPKKQTRRITVKKGQEFTPPEGWSLQAPSTASNLPYPIGKEITRDEGDKSITYRVTGYDEQNQPVLTKIAEAPRYKPAGSETDKPKRHAYRDTVTGAIHYYDENNPKDRETLRKFGRQLQPIVESPFSPIQREALEGVQSPSTGASSGKVLDAAKASPTIPRGAETGTYKGKRAYKLNNKFYDLVTGKEMK